MLQCNDGGLQKKFPSKVKMLRLKSRQGLIRARLEGAKLATGDVLLFLGKFIRVVPKIFFEMENLVVLFAFCSY